MPRTAVPVTTLNRQTGIAPTAYANSDASNGNTIPNDGKTWLELSNTDAGAQTVTVHPARTVDGQTVTATAHSIAAAGLLKLGPYPIHVYGDALQVNCSVNGLKLAAYRLPD